MNKNFFAILVVLFVIVGWMVSLHSTPQTREFVNQDNVREEITKAGEVFSSKKFYSLEGDLLAEQNFLGPVPHGYFKSYYEDGQLYYEKYYMLGFPMKEVFYYEDGTQKSPGVDDLERKLGKLFWQSNVKLHDDAGLLFSLARLYLKDEKNDYARKALETGLQLAPFHHAEQILLAKMELDDEEWQKAASRLEFVERTSQDKKTVQRARKLMDKSPFSNELFPNVAIPEIDKTLYIVVTENVDRVMAEFIAKEVSRVYAVKTQVLNDPYMIPEGTLEHSQDIYLSLVLRNVRKSLTRQQYSDSLKAAGLDAFPETLEDKKRLYQVYMLSSGQREEWDYREKTLASQLDADVILNEGLVFYKDLLEQPETFGVMIVTGADIRAEDLNFIFGTADVPSRLGLMSTARFQQDNPHRDVLMSRVSKQAFSTTGFIAGVGRCTMPNCARAYPHSLEEHDRKPNNICHVCLKRLIDVYQE